MKTKRLGTVLILILLLTSNTFAEISSNNIVIIEDAENKNTDGWTIFTNKKGVIANIKDLKRDSQVIKLLGKGMKTGYALSFPKWNNQLKTIEWKMKYNEYYAIYLLINTTKGVKYLRYSSLNYDKGKHGRYISFGLGSSSRDGKWHTFKRNMEKDLKKFEPKNNFLSINAFMIRGSGLIDDIKAIDTPPVDKFNLTKFNELLIKKKNNTESAGVISAGILNTSYERISYIKYFDTNNDHTFITFYTLSSDETKLEELTTINGIEMDSLSISNVLFNLDYSEMIIKALHDSKFIEYKYFDISSLPTINLVKKSELYDLEQFDNLLNDKKREYENNASNPENVHYEYYGDKTLIAGVVFTAKEDGIASKVEFYTYSNNALIKLFEIHPYPSRGIGYKVKVINNQQNLVITYDLRTSEGKVISRIDKYDIKDPSKVKIIGVKNN